MSGWRADRPAGRVDDLLAGRPGCSAASFQLVPVALKALPPVDVVVISHDHYDHLDYPTVRELVTMDLPIVTSLGVGAHLEALGRAARTHHRAGLVAALGAARPGVPGRRTGHHGGAFDLVMLEVGAFHPSWGDIHVGPENALEALRLLGGGPFLPVHWGTFNLALHAWDAPVETLLELAPKQGAQLVMPRLGEPVEPLQAETVVPWWREVDASGAPDASAAPAQPQPQQTLPKVMSWPVD